METIVKSLNFLKAFQEQEQWQDLSLN